MYAEPSQNPPSESIDRFRADFRAPDPSKSSSQSFVPGVSEGVQIRNSEFEREGAWGCNRFRISDFTVQISDFTKCSRCNHTPNNNNVPPKRQIGEADALRPPRALLIVRIALEAAARRSIARPRSSTIEHTRRRLLVCSLPATCRRRRKSEDRSAVGGIKALQLTHRDCEQIGDAC